MLFAIAFLKSFPLIMNFGSTPLNSVSVSNESAQKKSDIYRIIGLLLGVLYSLVLIGKMFW